MTQPKQDRRVRRTRESIHRALIGLMLEKGYEAVTVTDIIDRADVGRSTFYAHFTDKQHVLYDSLDELTVFLRAHHDDNEGQLFGFSLAMFDHAHEQRQLLRALLGRRGGAVVQARFHFLLADLVREELNNRTSHDQPPTLALELIVTCVVGAYMALLARWLDEDEPHTPQQMDEAFHHLVVPGVSAALHLEATPPPTSKTRSRGRFHYGQNR